VLGKSSTIHQKIKSKSGMTVRETLYQTLSKEETSEIASKIVRDEKMLSELMDCFFDANLRLMHKAANLLLECIGHDALVLQPYMQKLLDNLDGTAPEPVARNTFRLFQFIEVPEEFSGRLLDKAFLYFDDESQGIAVKVFAMTVIFNASLIWPELQNELAAMIEEKLPYGSAGFKNRGNKILKAIAQGKNSYN
jgi:hypothetical protein